MMTMAPVLLLIFLTCLSSGCNSKSGCKDNWVSVGNGKCCPSSTPIYNIYGRCCARSHPIGCKTGGCCRGDEICTEPNTCTRRSG